MWLKSILEVPFPKYFKLIIWKWVCPNTYLCFCNLILNVYSIIMIQNYDIRKDSSWYLMNTRKDNTLLNANKLIKFISYTAVFFFLMISRLGTWWICLTNKDLHKITHIILMLAKLSTITHQSIRKDFWTCGSAISSFDFYLTLSQLQ